MDMGTNETFKTENGENQQSTSRAPLLQNIAPAPKKKPLFPLEKRDAAFGICAVVFSIFTAVFGIFGGFAFGYLISCVLMSGLLAVYFAKRINVTVFPALCGVLSLANTSVFICTSNGSVRFFSAAVSILLSLVCFHGLLNGNPKGNRETLGVFYTAGATALNVDIVIRSLFESGDGKKKIVGKVLIGLVCAVPALFVIVPLLISSDDAFRGMMDNIVSSSAGNLSKALFGLILSVFVISYAFSLQKGRKEQAKPVKIRDIENVYIISFLSAISVCYLLYLFSQLAYFFSAFSGFLPDGQITYAEYARKGFFEMCVIAVINLVIVFLALLIAKKKDGKVCNPIKTLTTFVAIFTCIIISTAISKMALYIGVYGMTVLRLTTSAFMIFLAVIFISVILRIFLTKINIVKIALIAAGGILLVLGTVNVNAVCAKYNYENYVSGQLDSIDVNALYELGDEGIPYLVKLAGEEKSSVSANAKNYLAEAFVYDYFDGVEKSSDLTVSSLINKEKEKGFESFSIPKMIAYNSLYTFLEENPDFPEECCERLFNAINSKYPEQTYLLR